MDVPKHDSHDFKDVNGLESYHFVAVDEVPLDLYLVSLTP